MSIVVMITREQEIEATLGWGARFAKAREQPLVIVHPVIYPQEQPPIVLPLEQPCSSPLLESIRTQAEKLAEPPKLLHLQHPNRLAAIKALLKEEDASLLVTGHSSLQGNAAGREPSLRKALLKETNCDVLLLRIGSGQSAECRKILVPVAGGPHATAALQLAAKIAAQTETQVKAVYFEQEAGEEAEAVGQRVLQRVLTQAGIEPNNQIKTGVLLADNVAQGIIQAATDEGDVDLILLGASNLGFIRRTVFGSIPDRLLESQHPTSIGVMRSAQPLAARTRALLTRAFERVIPPLSREDRINLFEHLQQGSKTSVDFVMLICLSTAIAAFGLLQNSAAVIIGAMLVAPLMTPMLGMGLGLVQGNIVLVKRAIFSITIGFLLSFAVGLLIGLLVPSFQTLTSELTARGAPNILDLLVALLSGVAAAYALARPGMLEALPGVAIAAALVPPIATAGASLAIGRIDNAFGAASLFGINLVAIILASATTLYTLGIRAKPNQKRLWARRILIGLSLLAMLIALPLGMALLSQLPAPIKPMRKALTTLLSTQPGVRLAGIERQRSGTTDIVQIRLYTPRPVHQALAKNIAQIVQKYAGPQVQTRVISLLYIDISGTAAPKKANPPPSTARATQRPHTLQPRPIPHTLQPRPIPRTSLKSPQPRATRRNVQPSIRPMTRPSP